MPTPRPWWNLDDTAFSLFDQGFLWSDPLRYNDMSSKNNPAPQWVISGKQD